MSKPVVTFEDFAKLDLRVGKVEDCLPVSQSNKLLKLMVDFGKEGKRTILAGLAPWYEPEYFKGKNFVFVLNLEPKRMVGEESQGMLLATDSNPRPLPIVAAEESHPGDTLR